MSIEMLKTFLFSFSLHKNYMAAFYRIKWLRLKKLLTLHSVEVSSSPDLPPLFIIVFLVKQVEAVFLRCFSERVFLKILKIS